MRLLIVALVTSLSSVVIGQTPQRPKDVQLLVAGKIIRRRPEPNKRHSYTFDMRSGEFAQVLVEQAGVDLAVRVLMPQDTLYREIDNPNGVYGPEVISVTACEAGPYRVEVLNGNRAALDDYQIRLDGPRATTDSDKLRIAAEEKFAEAQLSRAGQKYESAISKYTEAAEIFRQLGAAREQAYSHTNMARVYIRMAQLPDQTEEVRANYFGLALNHFQEGIAKSREADDRPGQAFALNELGALYRNFGIPDQAVATYEAAIKLRLEIGDKYGLAQTYNNLALTYSNIGAQPSALQTYARAKSLWHEISAIHDEMNTLVNEGKANGEMGDLTLAYSQFQEVLSYCDAQPKGSQLEGSANYLRPFALNGIGMVQMGWDDPDSARDYYKKALDLFRANKDARNVANVLDNLGLLHAFLADTEQALRYFQEAKPIREELKDPKGLGVTLSNIGFAYALQGENDKALREFEQALPSSRKAGDRRFEAYTLVWMGMAHAALGNTNKALESYQQALSIQVDPQYLDLRGQAITLDKIGQVIASNGNPTEALKTYERALERWQNLKDAQGESVTLHHVAKLERDRGNLANARDFAEKAIKIVETLRHRVSGYKFQTTYFADKQDLYQLGIDVRMRLYELSGAADDLEAALALSERARARNLLDLLAAGPTKGTEKLSPTDSEKNSRLEREIVNLTQDALRSRSTGRLADAAFTEEKVAVHMRDQEELLTSARNNRKTDQTRNPPVSPKEIQQLLDDDTLLLEYSLDEKRSHLWTISRTSIRYYALAGKTEIENAARNLHQALSDFSERRFGESEAAVVERISSAPARYRTYAAELSRLILKDVAQEMGNKRIVIVADGSLHYVPFEALPRPELLTSTQKFSNKSSLLVNTNEIAYLPSASALATMRRSGESVASKKVAVLADPVFSNEKTDNTNSLAKRTLARSLRDIGDSGDSILQRLEYSRREANAIVAVAPRGSMKAVGFKANRSLVMSPVLKQFGFLHFATHGLLNEKNPELSGIVLSMVNKRGEPDDGYLTLHDIYNLDLPAKLVVVSACETGIAKTVRGEGLIGLTRGFMNAGARSVVVSLWRVEDEATAELMKRFYRNMFGKKQLSPSAALHQAKLEMKDFYDPYQWAGFVLQGDWK